MKRSVRKATVRWDGRVMAIRVRVVAFLTGWLSPVRRLVPAVGATPTSPNTGSRPDRPLSLPIGWR